MGATDTSSTASATGAAVASNASAEAAGGLPRDFFTKIYERLELQGNYLTPEQKALIEQVTQEEYDKQNRAQLVGMNVGALPANFMKILFSFIQKLFSGGNLPTTLAGFGGQLRDALSGATNSGKQLVVDTIAENTYERLLTEGKKDPKFADIADLVTGISKNGYARDLGGNASIVAALSAARNIQPVTEVADAGSGLSAALPTRRLTTAERSA